uniref:Integrase catalytic region n=1 Tax=Geobacter sp. (strain M21) TaxID=443144 RepID=C6DYY2_GEOSM
MQAETDFPVSVMCELLCVSRTGYYAWLRRPESQRKSEDDALSKLIKEIHEESDGEYGSPKIHQELRRRGTRCGRKRVARLMKKDGLKAKTIRKFKATTNSDHNLPVAENLLDRDFTPAEPNRAWAADITYVWTKEGWLYLAVVIDLFSRAVVGWSMSERMTRTLVMDAFTLAVMRRHPPPGLIHHSDRGSQYASGDFQRLLEKYGAICSMSRKGNCWDNAPAESFFAVLKRALVFHNQYETRDQARQSIFEYIERFYNRKRIHSSLGYRTPYEVDQLSLAA